MRKFILPLTFVAISIGTMIGVRRFYGDWAEGGFILILAIAGIVFWIFRK
jgi:hypothetical protein